MRVDSPPVTNARFVKKKSGEKAMGPDPPPENEEEEDGESAFGLDCDPDASESEGSDAEEAEAFEVPECSEVLGEGRELAAEPQRVGLPIPTPTRSDALPKCTFVASKEPNDAAIGLLHI